MILVVSKTFREGEWAEAAHKRLVNNIPIAVSLDLTTQLVHELLKKNLVTIETHYNVRTDSHVVSASIIVGKEVMYQPEPTYAISHI